jgi:hypothetical protein
MLFKSRNFFWTLLSIGLVCFIGSWIVGSMQPNGEALAYAVAPPQYPNSTFHGEWMGGTSLSTLEGQEFR